MAGQAITTRFVGPTNHRGARVKVYSQAHPRGRAFPWDDGLSVQGNHDSAALAYVRELGWFGVWVEGGTPDGRGSAYTCLAREHTGAQRERCVAIVRAVMGDTTDDRLYGAIYAPCPDSDLES